MRITGNCADADEAVQQALIAAWQRRDGFLALAKLSSWICRIVINRAYNILRPRQRDGVRQLEFLRSRSESGDHRAAQLEELQTAITGLPELYRDTMNLYLASGLDHAATARLAGCSVATLYTRLYHAKQLLRKRLEVKS